MRGYYGRFDPVDKRPLKNEKRRCGPPAIPFAESRDPAADAHLRRKSPGGAGFPCSAAPRPQRLVPSPVRWAVERGTGGPPRTIAVMKVNANCNASSAMRRGEGARST